MTDATDIKALRPAERDKLGFVTDDNTGGYYVAECEECGKIFPSQTCDGGEQIADSGDYGDCYCPHCGFIDPLECDNANLVWNVQQLKIVNLTKQLEAERQLREAAEKERDRLDASETQLIDERDSAEQALSDMYEAATGNRPEWSNMFQFADAVEGVSDCVAELRAKLANPVVLPTVQNFDGDEWYWKNAVINNIRAAGFTVREE